MPKERGRGGQGKSGNTGPGIPGKPLIRLKYAYAPPGSNLASLIMSAKSGSDKRIEQQFDRDEFSDYFMKHVSKTVYDRESS